MSRRHIFRWGFLGVTGLAIALELVASFDGRDDTEPWTVLIVDHIPGEVTTLAIGALALWLPVHFGLRYWRKHQQKESK